MKRWCLLIDGTHYDISKCDPVVYKHHPFIVVKEFETLAEVRLALIHRQTSDHAAIDASVQRLIDAIDSGEIKE